jgi:hypothetical protein
VQVPDSVLPKNVIGVADIRRVDFLIAETSMMNLLSHHHLHKRKRSEQNGCYAERDFVQWHKDKFYSWSEDECYGDLSPTTVPSADRDRLFRRAITPIFLE